MLKYRLLLIFDDTNGQRKTYEVMIVAPDKCSAYDQAAYLVDSICRSRLWILVDIILIEMLDTRS